MCGYFTAFSRYSANWPQTKIAHATEGLAKRGADSSGYLKNQNMYMTHHRLQVIDNSPLSDQPFQLNDNYFLVFTGEIYNHHELREQALQEDDPAQFKTESDTETLIHMYQTYKEQAFQFLEGEFSGVIYSADQRKVVFFRDPVGVKPIYYSVGKDCLYVSDLMTPVRRMISSEQINPQALGEHIALRYPLGEHTIIKQIFKLKPGSYAEYWLDRDKFQITSYNQNSTKAFDLQSQLSRQFSQRAQYKNSGLFLSSGVDSSLLASFSKDSDFEGFTMSMDDGSEANEALAAARYSKHLGLPHHTVHCHFDSVDEVEQAVSESVEILEEPLGDSVALLQSQLFKAMGAMTKVALSGEAADEIFMGYSHHRAALMYSCLPKLVFGSVPNQLLGAVVSTLNPYPVAIDQSDLKRLARGLAGGFSQLVQELCTVVDLQKIKKICPQAETETVEHYFQSIRNLHDLRAKELENWLPNYNFARIDKLSLNAGLEVRLPYADRKLILSEAVTGRVSVLKKQKWTLHHLARQRISRPYWPVAKRPFTILKSSSYATHIEAFCKRELQQKDTSHYFEPAQLSSILETENSMFYWKALYNLTSLKLWLRSLV